MGKTYVPLNPNQPKERHTEVIESVHTHTILSADAKYATLVEGVKVVSTSKITHENYISKDVIKIASVLKKLLTKSIY